MNYIMIDQINWSALLGMDATLALVVVTFLLVVATFLLAWATYRLSKDSSKNIRLSKDNLVEQHLLREMKFLIIPLYKKIIEYKEYFGDLEYVRFEYTPSNRVTKDDTEFNKNYNYGRKFWDNIDINKYLAPNDLRNLLEDYLNLLNEWGQKNKSSRIFEIANKDVGVNPSSSTRETLSFLHSLLINYINKPQIRVENSQLQNLDDLIKKLEPESDIFKCAKELRDFVETDTALKNKREELIKLVKTQYGELEGKIDKLHKSLNQD